MFEGIPVIGDLLGGTEDENTDSKSRDEVDVAEPVVSRDGDNHTKDNRKPERSARPGQEQQRYCINCGSEITSDARFCPDCGVESPLLADPDQQASRTDQPDTSDGQPQSEASGQSGKDPDPRNSTSRAAEASASSKQEPTQNAAKAEDREQTDGQPASEYSAAPHNSDSSESLETLAGMLGTDTNPQSIISGVEALAEGLDTVINSIGRPGEYGIRRSDTVINRSAQLTQAIDRNELQLSETTTNSEIKQYRELQAALESLSLDQAPDRLGKQMSREFDSFESDGVRKLTEVGQTLQSTTGNAQGYREDYEQLARAAESICDSAKSQTAISIEDHDTERMANQLTEELDRGSVWFADDTTGISEAAINVQSRGGAESKPAKEFLQTVQNTHTLPDSRVEKSIIQAVDAIDQTETIATRLEGVDPESLVGTVDQLLSEIEGQTHEFVSPLRNRLEDLKQMTQRATGSDLLNLYAVKQELRYYDRTLVPQLSAPERSADEAQGLDRRIDTLGNRRARMRQSYPSEYPDCDHTIPIYFFDFVSVLVEQATELQEQNNHQQAAGVADAADQTLDRIEGLYETHSYFVLLKQLRG